MTKPKRRPNLTLPIEPYDALREVEPDLYVVDGDWGSTRSRRRMTIMRTRAGELVIHNPIRLQDADYLKIEALGLVTHIIAPNAFHQSDGAYYRFRFPLAVYYPPGSSGGRHWPAGLRKEIDSHSVAGLRFLDETVFFHRISRTLVVTDLVFNLHDRLKGLEKWLSRLNRVDDRFGPSRIFQYFFVRNKIELGRSLAHILRWDFERVIMSHGDLLERGGPKAIQSSFSEAGIRPVL